MQNLRPVLYLALCLIALTAGCSSTRDVKKEKYADLRTEWTFEADFKSVWLAIERALAKNTIATRDPEAVEENDWKDTDKRNLETEWVYSQSKDKYVSYEVNGFPKRKLLQTRLRYKVYAERVMGGVHVEVKMDEEIENLNKKGEPQGYEAVDEIDTQRPNKLLEQIKLQLWSTS